MYYWSVSKAVQFAKEQTANAASVKAWRITTKAGRAFECYPMGDKMRVVFYMGGHGYDVFMSVAEFMQCVEYSQSRINREE